jgi:hypothetical protein
MLKVKFSAREKSKKIQSKLLLQNIRKVDRSTMPLILIIPA